MKNTSNNTNSGRRDFWVISEETETNPNLHRAYRSPVREYRISELGRYLLDPKPVMIKRRMIGCEVAYRQPPVSRLKALWGGFRPAKARSRDESVQIPLEEFIESDGHPRPVLKDPGLEAHFSGMLDQLRPFEPVVKRLSQLDPGRVADVRGICDNGDGTRMWLALKGSPEEKIRYMLSVYQRNVRVSLDRYHHAENLFNLDGFDFRGFSRSVSYRLLSKMRNGRPEGSVFNPDGSLAYKFSNTQLMKHLFMMQLCLQKNDELSSPFRLCRQGRAKALSISFNGKIAIDYTAAKLPGLYRDMFRGSSIGMKERDVVVKSLNSLQFGVFFRYIPQTGESRGKPCTAISVLHDLKALEPLKRFLPKLYAQVQGAAGPEAGGFYLMDAMIER